MSMIHHNIKRDTFKNFPCLVTILETLYCMLLNQWLRQLSLNNKKLVAFLFFIKHGNNYLFQISPADLKQERRLVRQGQVAREDLGSLRGFSFYRSAFCVNQVALKIWTFFMSHNSFVQFVRSCMKRFSTKDTMATLNTGVSNAEKSI